MTIPKTSKNKLENELFKSVYEKTPDYVKELNLMDFSNDGEFSFILKKEHLEAYDEKKNPEGLNLKEWFANYAKEAKVSTAGIRGPQNILYPQDTRFPINLVGIVLATLAKALVAKEKYKGKEIVKVAGREVRYNSELFLDAIARIQAANGIKTLAPVDRKTIPIWLASFLAFKLDLLGGEYITSSHGISVKNATKDLNSQGSQYLPEESLEFVDKIQEIFNETEKKGSYEIKIAAKDNPLIDEKVMSSPCFCINTCINASIIVNTIKGNLSDLYILFPISFIFTIFPIFTNFLYYNSFLFIYTFSIYSSGYFLSIKLSSLLSGGMFFLLSFCLIPAIHDIVTSNIINANNIHVMIFTPLFSISSSNFCIYGKMAFKYTTPKMPQKMQYNTHVLPLIFNIICE